MSSVQMYSTFSFLLIEPEHDDRKRMGMKVWLFVNSFLLYYTIIIIVFVAILFKVFIDYDHVVSQEKRFEMWQYYCSLFNRCNDYPCG